MHSVQIAIAPPSSNVRPRRSAMLPNTRPPPTPTSTIDAEMTPSAVSLTPNASWMPSNACASESRSPCSSATVPASVTTGIAP